MMTIYKEVQPLRGIEEVKPLLPILKELGGVCAGGFPRYCASPNQQLADQPADIDIFCRTTKAYEDILKAFKASQPIDGLGFYLKQAKETNFAVTFRYYLKLGMKATTVYNIEDELPPLEWVESFPVQVVKPKDSLENHGRPADIVNKFDFTVIQAFIDNETGSVFVHPDFEEHENAKQLVVTRLDEPLDTLNRVVKYVRKGYNIQPSQFKLLLDSYGNMSSTEREASNLRSGYRAAQEYVHAEARA